MPCWVWALRIGSVGASRQQDDSLLSRKVGWPWICSSPSVQPQAGPWPVATTPAANLLVGVVCDLHAGEHGHGTSPVLHGHVVVGHLHERHRPAITSKSRTVGDVPTLGRAHTGTDMPSALHPSATLCSTSPDFVRIHNHHSPAIGHGGHVVLAPCSHLICLANVGNGHGVSVRGEERCRRFVWFHAVRTGGMGSIAQRCKGAKVECRSRAWLTHPRMSLTMALRMARSAIVISLSLR